MYDGKGDLHDQLSHFIFELASAHQGGKGLRSRIRPKERDSQAINKVSISIMKGNNIHNLVIIDNDIRVVLDHVVQINGNSHGSPR
ncbi:hypothetical protein GQ457_13G010610 [Hibiscus cannabinus]